MNIKKELINASARLIFNNQIWADAKMFVADVQNKDGLKGPEKKAKVVKTLQILFEDVSIIMLESIVQIAALWLKTK